MAPARLAAPLLVIALTLGCATSSPVPGSPGLADTIFPTLGNGGYDVQHYHLALDIDPTANTLQGDATITAVAEHALSSFNLDLVGLEVDSIEVDGSEAGYQRDGRELIILPAKPLSEGSEFTVEVSWHGNPDGIATSAIPMKVGWNHVGDEVFVLSQPVGAAGYFPCNDHPLDKATYSFEITAPKSHAVVANGTPGETAEREDGRVMHRYSSRDPMATYLVTLAVAHLELVESSTADGLPIYHWFATNISEANRANFDVTAEMLTFFSERFGDYPFESYGAIVSSLPFPGALETQTIPVYGSSATAPSIIAHEMAHQWFGNSVALQDWSEIWLNEGFASYASNLWSEHADAEAGAKQSQRMEAIMRAQQMGPVAPVAEEDLFGGAVYVRGSFVLKALHDAVGDDVFFDIMRTFHSQHLNGNAVLVDFVELAVAKGGPEQRALLEAWLYDAVPPAAEPIAVASE